MKNKTGKEYPVGISEYPFFLLYNIDNKSTGRKQLKRQG